MAAIFNDFDAFNEQNQDSISPQKDIVHIRIQQRNGRKTLTTVQGLSDEYDLNQGPKSFSKKFFANYNSYNFNTVHVKKYWFFRIEPKFWDFLKVTLKELAKSLNRSKASCVLSSRRIWY